jgi:hypothetical protein
MAALAAAVRHVAYRPDMNREYLIEAGFDVDDPKGDWKHADASLKLQYVTSLAQITVRVGS